MKIQEEEKKKLHHVKETVAYLAIEAAKETPKDHFRTDQLLKEE